MSKSTAPLRTERYLAAALLLLICTICPAQKKPLIGISTGFNDNCLVVVNSAYCRSVELAGGVPIPLPFTKNPETAREAVGMIDGIIFTGGEDIDPAYYGQSRINGTVEVNADRDTSDFLFFRAAEEKGIPILGICRGEQLMAAATGGALIQDIPSQIPCNVGHSPSAESAPLHTVYLVPGSRLQAIFGADSLQVNSFHHQAVHIAGKGLVISARSKDNIAEGIEGPDMTGVQFHPEKFAAEGDNVFLRIFEYLVNEAK